MDVKVYYNHESTYFAVRIGRFGIGLLRWPWVRSGGFWPRLWSCKKLFNFRLLGWCYVVRFLYFIIQYECD